VAATTLLAPAGMRTMEGGAGLIKMRRGTTEDGGATRDRRWEMEAIPTNT
jgi:hypothetical protein